MNRFLERVMRQRDLEQERALYETPAKSLAPSRGRPPLGQRRGVKVDDETRRRILERALQPGFQINVAKEFGVSQMFVSKLLKDYRAKNERRSA